MLEQGVAADRATPPPPQPPGGGGSILRAFRAESRKLARQTPTQVLALACLLGPPAFGAVLRLQGGVPGDALFGVWVHSSGFAVSLVILGFAGSWGFPLIAGVLAGDMFSSEDRYGTWKTLLTRSCSRGEVFAGKVLAAASFAIAMVAITAIASLIGGLIVAGDHPLVSLSGTLLVTRRGAGSVADQLARCACRPCSRSSASPSCSRSSPATGSWASWARCWSRSCSSCLC